MTATALPTPSTPAPAVADHRPGLPLRGLAVTAGGLLFAAGNALHPMEHSAAAHSAATWVAAHVVFSAGALLIAAGAGALAARLAPSRVATVGLAVLWVGLTLIPVGGYTEAYVAPALHDGFAAIEEATLWFSALAGTATLLGPLLIAIGALRHRLLPAPVALSLVALPVGGVLAGVLPVEGWGIIPGTVVFGLGIAAAGWSSRSRD
ncbi:hypothetical protein LY71_12126 [Geodermatophilus tzadiensis]|uniref:Uncharacterized protein n=1 Tax=Geodermatophilus tzadiensis TaxID=1137988 RepID=A0A2T0T137_9ACTN|nr:hypothetical protein [Geodermatophilus tzadiensis]PRY39357.1 hypothetical protein LY71_12126 [Geodermatophilus tzadiensis]